LNKPYFVETKGGKAVSDETVDIVTQLDIRVGKIVSAEKVNLNFN